MSVRSGPGPRQRRLLWTVLATLVLAIAVTAVMAPRWRAGSAGQPPPRLGRAPTFELVNRDGRRIASQDLRGAPWVADFIFTRCALSCPRMTSRMVQLREMLPAEVPLVRVSISVDPEFDTSEVLQNYARSWGIEDEEWLFLTGEKDAVHALVSEGFRLALDVDPAPAVARSEEPILHSVRFVLVDGDGDIRGYYDVRRGTELSRLVRDLRALQPD